MRGALIVTLAIAALSGAYGALAGETWSWRIVDAVLGLANAFALGWAVRSIER